MDGRTGALRLHFLGKLPGYSESTAQDVNDDDQVVGSSFGTRSVHAMLYTNGQLLSLPAATANVINNHGVIGGVDSNNVVLIDAATCTALLFPFDPAVYAGSVPYDINDNGQYVGNYQRIGGPFNETYVAQGTTIDPFGFTGFALGVNVQGDVVGWRSVVIGSTSTQEPFIRDHVTGAVTVPLMPGDQTGAANAIYDLGQVVGFSGTISSYTVRPFIYQHGQITSLEQLSLNHDESVQFSAGILEPITARR